MIQAVFETPNFTFEVFAPSETSAFKLLERAWHRHATEHHADPDYIYQYKDDITYRDVSEGTILRDGQLLEQCAEV